MSTALTISSFTAAATMAARKMPDRHDCAQFGVLGNDSALARRCVR